MSDLTLWHGGIPGLKPGEVISGGHQRQTRDDCPICAARAAGESVMDPPSAHPDRVYLTAVRLYAKFYASLYGYGDLYRVRPIGEIIRSSEDTIETYTAGSAEVISVYDRAVMLTWSERRRLFREWGLADQTFAGSRA